MAVGRLLGQTPEQRGYFPIPGRHYDVRRVPESPLGSESGPRNDPTVHRGLYASAREESKRFSITHTIRCRTPLKPLARIPPPTAATASRTPRTRTNMAPCATHHHRSPMRVDVLRREDVLWPKLLTGSWRWPMTPALHRRIQPARFNTQKKLNTLQGTARGRF